MKFQNPSESGSSKKSSVVSKSVIFKQPDSQINLSIPRLRFDYNEQSTDASQLKISGIFEYLNNTKRFVDRSISTKLTRNPKSYSGLHINRR